MLVEAASDVRREGARSAGYIGSEELDEPHEDVCEDQVPLLPYEGGSLNCLYTLFSSGVDLVQFLVGILA